MNSTIADLPELAFSNAEIMSGELPTLCARAAIEHGPILKHTVSGGPFAGEQYVFMVGPEANRFVMLSHREHFSHDLGWTPIIGDSLGHGLLNMDGPEHARHRKMWNPAFTGAYMAAYVPILHRVIAERTASWVDRAEVDLYSEAREITFDVAASALAGLRTGEEVDRMRDLFYELLHGFDAGYESWEHYLERMLAARGELAAVLLGMIEARRNEPPEGSPRDVLDMIVHALDDRGDGLSDEQILAHLNILLVAGHETTTTLAAWALRLLSVEPEHAQRVRRELDPQLDRSDGVVTMDVLRSARFLDAFIRETGRLYPPVINVPRGVVREFEFAGHVVPVGTQVRLALAACHRLPDIFNEPALFDPDRFLPPRDEDRRNPYALVTFGGGPRTCIGINFAQVEVKALVAHVLPRYHLVPVGDPPVHAGHWTAVVPGGMPMRVSRAA